MADLRRRDPEFTLPLTPGGERGPDTTTPTIEPNTAKWLEVAAKAKATKAWSMLFRPDEEVWRRRWIGWRVALGRGQGGLWMWQPALNRSDLVSRRFKWAEARGEEYVDPGDVVGGGEGVVMGAKGTISIHNVYDRMPAEVERLWSGTVTATTRRKAVHAALAQIEAAPSIRKRLGRGPIRGSLVIPAPSGPAGHRAGKTWRVDFVTRGKAALQRDQRALAVVKDVGNGVAAIFTRRAGGKGGGGKAAVELVRDGVSLVAPALVDKAREGGKVVLDEGLADIVEQVAPAADAVIDDVKDAGDGDEGGEGGGENDLGGYTKDHYWEDGRYAARNGYAFSNNPGRPGSWQHAAWAEGWKTEAGRARRAAGSGVYTRPRRRTYADQPDPRPRKKEVIGFAVDDVQEALDTVRSEVYRAQARLTAKGPKGAAARVEADTPRATAAAVEAATAIEDASQALDDANNVLRETAQSVNLSDTLRHRHRRLVQAWRELARGFFGPSWKAAVNPPASTEIGPETFGCVVVVDRAPTLAAASFTVAALVILDAAQTLQEQAFAMQQQGRGLHPTMTESAAREMLDDNPDVDPDDLGNVHPDDLGTDVDAGRLDANKPLWLYRWGDRGREIRISSPDEEGSIDHGVLVGRLRRYATYIGFPGGDVNPKWAIRGAVCRDPVIGAWWSEFVGVDPADCGKDKDDAFLVLQAPLRVNMGAVAVGGALSWLPPKTLDRWSQSTEEPGTFYSTVGPWSYLLYDGADADTKGFLARQGERDVWSRVYKGNATDALRHGRRAFATAARAATKAEKKGWRIGAIDPEEVRVNVPAVENARTKAQAVRIAKRVVPGRMTFVEQYKPGAWFVWIKPTKPKVGFGAVGEFTKPQRRAISAKIRKLLGEGRPRAQAVAMALNMARAGRLGPRGGYRRGGVGGHKSPEVRVNVPAVEGAQTRAQAVRIAKRVVPGRVAFVEQYKPGAWFVWIKPVGTKNDGVGAYGPQTDPTLYDKGKADDSLDFPGSGEVDEVYTSSDGSTWEDGETIDFLDFPAGGDDDWEDGSGAGDDARRNNFRGLAVS